MKDIKETNGKFKGENTVSWMKYSLDGINGLDWILPKKIPVNWKTQH